jgi:hypothetical protein
VGTAVSYFSLGGNFLHTGDGVADDNTIANNLLAQLGSGTLTDFWMDEINPLHVSAQWNGVPVFSTDGGTTWVKPAAPYQQAQCIAPDGSYLCLSTPNDLTLNFSRSPDGGETWTPGSLTLSSPIQVQYQPALRSDRLWTDSAGNLWLSLTGENNLYPNQAWPMQIVKSADNGQSFAVTASYSSPYTPPYGVGLFVSGTTLLLFAPIAGTSGAPREHFLIARSTDGVTFTQTLVTTNYNTALNTSHGTGSIYKGGVYGNTSSGASSQFNTPFCNAYTSDANMKSVAYVYTNQPIGGQLACSFNPPAAQFDPIVPPCNPPTVILQYSLNCVADPSDSRNSQVDLDSANAVGVASMW